MIYAINQFFNDCQFQSFMIFSDKKILESIANGEIKIEPFRPDCMGTNSYDVHLGKWLASKTASL